jgi:nitrite reductase (NO-forming)
MGSLVAVALSFLTVQASAQQHHHGAAASPPAMRSATPPTMPHAPTVFTLRTGIAEGRMAYVGVGGDIDGRVNPTLMVHEGETVRINLINGEEAEHDLVIDQYGAHSDHVVGRNASATISFAANRVGEFAYLCSLSGHREAGMEGLVQVMPGARDAMASTP